MKNSLIHEGLEKSSIRNFLAIQLETAQSLIIKLKPKSVRYVNIESVIQNDKLQIEYLKERIMLHEQVHAVITLIKTNGWEEFDVSDFVEKDCQIGWLSFIGTKEEHEELLKKIEKEN